MGTETDTYKLNVGNYIYGAGQPTIILTADTSSKPNAYGECFIFMYLMHDDKTKYYEQSIEFDTTGSPIDIDLPYMLNEALIQANVILSQHLYNYYTSISHSEIYFSRDHYHLVEADNSSIISLIIRNKFLPQISRIMTKTRSQNLRRFLVDCMQLRIINITNIYSE